MAITANSANNIVRALNQKVRDGILDKDIAKRLAVLAMQEVAVAEQEPEAEEATPEDEPTEETEETEETEPAAPVIPVIDPKTQLLSLLTAYEAQTATAFKKLKESVEAIVKGTTGPAFPLGTFDTKAGQDNVVHLKIEAVEGKKDTAKIVFSFDRKWELAGVAIPTTASVKETVCHLALRKDIVAAADDVVDFTETDLAWERYMTPVKTVNQVKAFAKNHNDPKINEIIAAVPESKDRGDWRKWAVATQAYLLGSDYSQDKNFVQVLETVESEEN